MRLANIDHRACVVHDDHYFDISEVSGGRFCSDVQSLYSRWDELIAWYRSEFSATDHTAVHGTLYAPAPRPAQAFGVGLNYADHAKESELPIPKSPMIFPKFSSCISGPDELLHIDNDTVDWEVELVAVIGRRCRNVDAAQAWDYVAGLTIGQDISDRTLQFSDPSTPQFGLGKSKQGYGPIGPALVTIDELPDPSRLSIGCTVNGEQMQASNTTELIFDVPALVAYLSNVVTLYPGDLIFTGTPSGVGLARSPARYLGDNDVVTSKIEGLGTLITKATTDPRPA